MKVTPCPHGLEEFVGKSILPRSTGLHVSDIYNDLYKRLEPARFGGTDGPDPLRLEAGLSFEGILEEGLKQRLGTFRPGELISEEGIAMSPDLVIFNGHPRVGEIKLTWMSAKEFPIEVANNLPARVGKWVLQMKCYCRVMETPYARLIGFFVNGNYRPMAPKLLAWDIEFSRRELDDAWALVLRHGREMEVL